jgi:hypothetical protein
MGEPDREWLISATLTKAAGRIEALEARLAAEHRRGIELAEHLDKVLALAAAEVKRANEAEAALAALRERHPEPEGVVEEPPRDNSITDAW